MVSRSKSTTGSADSKPNVKSPAREWSRGDASDIDGQAARPKRAGANESKPSELRFDPRFLLEPTGTKAIATNAGYAKLFAELGAGSLAVGIALVVLIPFLRKLITDKAETPPAEMSATVVLVA